MERIIRDAVKAESAILDGEIVVIDTDTGESVPFGMNKSVALDQDGDEANSNFKLCCMDVKFHNLLIF